MRFALRSALTAVHLFGLAGGAHLRKMRAHADPLRRLQARVQKAELRAQLVVRANELLVARFSKIPEHRRPHYSPAQRFEILELRRFLAWSARETAQLFLVCPNTIHNWERAVDPAARTVGSTVKPTPPIRRVADVVRSIARAMSLLGFGGQEQVARALARAGWRNSARSVGRFRKEHVVPSDPAPPRAPSPGRTTAPVVARFVHHVWMMDVSVVRQFLGGPDLYMAAVFDAFSRTPLALRVFGHSPGAAAFANPRHVITDQGGEFTGRAFRRAVARLRASHRFTSVGSLLATARLERWWRTLKETAGLYRLRLPLTVHGLEGRLQLALPYYVGFRPHSGLDGATPLEVFARAEPAHTVAIAAPRGRPGEGASDTPFEIAFLDPGERRFPILIAAA